MNYANPPIDLSLNLGDLHTIRYALSEYAAKFAAGRSPMLVEAQECIAIKLRIESAIEAWIKS
jgi:hypothetical protein